jgi:hypothetical protein
MDPQDQDVELDPTATQANDDETIEAISQIQPKKTPVTQQDKWAGAPDAGSNGPSKTSIPSQVSQSIPAPDKWAGSPGSTSDFQQAYKTVSDTNAAQNADVAKTARALGQAPDVVSANLEEAKKATTGMTPSQLKAFEATHPELAQLLANKPEILASTYDDLQALSDHADMAQNMDRFQKVGQVWNNMMDFLGNAAKETKDFGSDVVSSMDQSLAGLTRFIGNYGPQLAAFTNGLAIPDKKITAPLQQFVEKNLSEPLTEDAKFMQSNEARADANAPFFSGATVRNAATGLLGMAPTGFNPVLMGESAAGEARQATLERGGTEAQANANAAIHGLVNLVPIPAAILPGFLRGAAGRALENVVKGTVTSGAAGFGMNAINQLADYVTGDPHGLDNWLENSFKSAGTMALMHHMSMAAGVLSHGLLKQGPPALEQAQADIQTQKAEVNRDFYQQNGEMAKAEKLSDRDPVAHGEVLDAMMPNTKAVFPTDALTSFYQKAGKDPGEELAKLGFGDNWQEAQTTGHFEAPLSDWTAKTIKMPEYAGLADDFKTDPADLSMNELKARTAQIGAKTAQVDAEAQETAGGPVADDQDAKFVDSVRAVQKDMEAKFQAAGEAKTQSASHLFAQFFGRLGQRMGQDPFELYKKVAYTITGRGGEGLGVKPEALAPSESYQQKEGPSDEELRKEAEQAIGPVDVEKGETPEAHEKRVTDLVERLRKGVERGRDYNRRLGPSERRVLTQEDLDEANRRSGEDRRKTLPESDEVKNSWKGLTALSKEINKETDPEILRKRVAQITADGVHIDPDGNRYIIDTRGIKRIEGPNGKDITKNLLPPLPQRSSLSELGPDEKSNPPTAGEGTSGPKGGGKGPGGSGPGFLDRLKRSFFQRGSSPSDKLNSPQFKNWFGESKVVDDQGKPLVVYHGSQRPDRIGERFLKKRATSGPMSFFTDDPNVASGYGTGKVDTSRLNEDDNLYENWFKFKPEGSKTKVPLDKAWNYLSEEQKKKIAALAPRVGETDDGDLTLHPEGHEKGLGGYDQHLKEAKGNHLKALVEEWLSSGQLFDDEEKFIDVLKMAGMKGVEFDSPNIQNPGIIPVHLSIKKPLDTSKIPEEIVQKLISAAEHQPEPKFSRGVDNWDKSAQSPKEWVERLKSDQQSQNKEFHTTHAWTSIPDWVTKVLKKEGYDGIKDTGGKYTDKSHNVWIPFEPTQIKSAIGNEGGFDPKNPNILKQASAEDELGRTDIQMTKTGPKANIFFGPKAKASTPFHEAAHTFLAIYDHLAQQDETPQEIKDDLDKLKKDWFGLKEGEKIGEKEHEKFAEAWVKEVKEGGFPAAEPWLKRIFKRFSEWLKGEWQTDAEKNTERAPEFVREIMQRMVASDEAIAKAQHDTGFREEDLKGLPAADARTLGQMHESARRQAEQEVLAQLMKETTPEHKALVEEERKRLTDEATQSVDGLPVERAKKDLEDQLGGAGGAADVAKRMLEGRATAAEAGALDAVAMAHPDLGSGPELAQRIHDGEVGGLREKAIQGLIDAGMAKYQDAMKDPARMRELAMKAIHGARVTEVLAMEKALYDHMVAGGKQAFSEAQRKRAVLDAQLAKGKAIEILGHKAPSEAGNPRTYYTAERNMAVKAALARRRGDWQAAADLKEKQMLNHALARQAEANARDILASRKFFKNFNASDADLAKTRETDLVDVGRAILAQHGVGQSTGSAPLEHLENLRQYATDADTYETLKEMIEQTSLDPSHLEAMPYDRYQDVEKVLRALWDLSRNVKRFELNGQMMERQEVIQKLADRNAEILAPKRKNGESDADYQARAQAIEAKRLEKTQRAPTDLEKAGVHLLDLKAATGMVQFWAEKMDGLDENKPYQNALVYKVRDAANNYRAAKLVEFQKIHDVLKPIEKTLSNKPIYSPELKYTFKGTAEVMGALQHTGNASNKQKLLRGNGWGNYKVDDEGKLMKGPDGKPILDTSKWDAFLRRMIQEGVLTKAHFDAVQKIWDVYDELKPQIQAAHKRMYGFHFDEVAPTALKTPFGEYKGGYVPAKVDPYKNDDAKTRQEKDALEGQYNGFAWPTTGKGATLKRVEAYAAPLLMDLGLATNHLDWALRFIHIEPHVKELGRVLFDKGFTQSLKQVDPAAKSGMLAPWLQRSARQRVETPSSSAAMDWFFRNLRKNTGQIMLTANFADTLSRTMSLPMATLKVSPVHLANALCSYIRNPGDVAAANQAESKFMQTRHGISGFDITQGINQVLNPSTWRKFNDFKDRHAYALQEVVHHVMDNTVYLAAKNQALAHGLGPEEARREAEDTVVKTQGSYNPEDVSRAQTGTPMLQCLNMFWGFFNTQANLLGTESHKIFEMQGLKPKMARGLFLYTMGLAVPAVMWQSIHNLIGGRGLTGAKKDDEGDNTTLDWLKWYFGSQLEQSAQMVPGVGTVVKALTEGKMDDSPIVEMVKTAAETMRGEPFSKVQEGKGARTATRDALATLQLLTGLPTAWVTRAASYAAGLANNEYEPDSAADLVRGLVSGTPGPKNR